VLLFLGISYALRPLNYIRDLINIKVNLALVGEKVSLRDLSNDSTFGVGVRWEK
jgi:hypothetical protein